MIHQSIISCSSNDTLSNPGRLGSSTTLLWELQISKYLCHHTHCTDIYKLLSFRDGRSDDEDDDEDCEGFNGDSGDFPSLENSGKTSPSSGEYPTAGAANFLTVNKNLVLIRNAVCFSKNKTCSNYTGHCRCHGTGGCKQLHTEE